MTLIERLRKLVDAFGSEAENDGYKDRPMSDNTHEAKTMLLDAIEALQAENERLKAERERNLDSIRVNNEIISKRNAELSALAAKLVPLTDSACAEFAKEYLEAWEDGMAGDSYLRRKAENALKLDAAIDAAKGGQHEDA